MRFTAAARTPHLETLIRSRGWAESDGKRHRLAVATAPLHVYAITTPAPLHSDVAVHNLFSNSGATSSTSTAVPRIVAKRGFIHRK
jgi:hypothetical protein